MFYGHNFISQWEVACLPGQVNLLIFPAEEPCIGEIKRQPVLPAALL
jgi:hypothetical protein